MRFVSLLIASFLTVSASAQSPLKSVKTGTNPLSAYNFCADPTAVEYDGRVYVYGTNDQQQFDEGGKFSTNGNDYGKINSLVCMSSADLVNWTWHKPIEVKTVAKWTNCSWAPSICSRVEEDGQTHFYLYFANGASGIGVLTSTSPIGPWKDPLGKAMIPWGMAGMGDITWLFDPGVVVDENGTGWLAWGGGGGIHQNNVAKGANDMLDMNTRIAKLNPDMITIAPENITILPAPYHFEASELNIIGGKFVYTYCSNWESDRSKWNQFNYYDKSKSKPAAPGVAQMCYMVSTDPLNADSWQYVGMYAKNPSAFGYPGGNNHTHLQKFNNGYYLFYHAHNTEGELKKVYGGDKGGYRNIQVNNIAVDEAKCKISEVTMSNSGTTIRNNRPSLTERQEAEMLWNNSGIGFTYAGRANNPYTYVSPKSVGSWTAVKNAIADSDVKSFSARLRGKGKMEIRVNDINAAPAGVVEFNSTSFQDYSISLNTPFKTASTLYFVFTELSGSTNDFDYWQFYTEDLNAISSAEINNEVISEEYYTLSGVKCLQPVSGPCIVKRNFANGKSETEKVVK